MIDVSVPKAVIYCNDGKYGGSTIQTAKDRREVSWWSDCNIKGSLPPGESILICDIDIDSLAIEVGVSNPQKSTELIYLGSVTYENDSNSGYNVSKNLPIVTSIENETARKNELDRLAKSTGIDNLQIIRINHLSQLAGRGLDSKDWWNRIGRDCVLNSIPSLKQIEGSMANLCKDKLLNNISTSSRNDPDVAKSLLGFIQDCQTYNKYSTVAINDDTRQLSHDISHIYDRDDDVGDILRFIDNRNQITCQVSGLQQIGKTSVINKSLVQSRLSRIKYIPLHENSSADYIIYYILRENWPAIRPPYKSIKEICDSTEFRSALSRLDVIVIENADKVISYRTWHDENIHDLYLYLINLAIELNIKIILETNFDLPIEFSDQSKVIKKRVFGLDKKLKEYGVMLLEGELRSAGFETDILNKSEKTEIVNKLGGHPVVISLFANAIYEHGVQKLLEDVRKKKGFYTQYVGRLVNSLNLNSDEQVLLKLLSGCRISIPRETVLGSCDFNAGPALRRLIQICAAEVRPNGNIESAGIIKSYFNFNDLPNDIQNKLHRNAGREYEQLSKLNPDLLSYAVEADYHNALAGSSVRLVKGLADSHLSAAQELYNKQKYEKAKGILDSLLKSMKTRSALKLSTLVDAKCGNFDTALIKAKEVFSMGSTDPWLLSELAKIALNLYRHDIAEELIKTAKAAGIDDVSVMIIEGRMCLRNKQLKEAESVFKKATIITTWNAWPYFYHGKILMRIGKNEKAIDVLCDGEQFIYRKNIRSRKVLIAIRTLLAQAYLLENKDDIAEQVIMTLFEENKDDPELVRTYAALTLKREGVANAQKAFEKLASAKIRNRNDRCQMHLFMGLFYLGVNDPVKANQEFSKAHSADRTNVFVLMKWSKTLYELAESAFVDGEEHGIALGYAIDCARIVKQIIKFDSDNTVGLNLQEDLYARFKIDTGSLDK